jgi:hypothetical protein
MSVKLDPLVSEFETDERAESYDRWFKEKVRQAVESASPRLAHDDAVAKVAALLEDKRARRAGRSVG